MIKYSFTGPYKGKTFGKLYTFYGIKSEDGNDFINNIAYGHLLKSSNVTKELQEIQKVLSGQKAKHDFGGSEALYLLVTVSETEFYNGLTDVSYGKVPTVEVVKLLTEWRDFLVSKGQ